MCSAVSEGDLLRKEQASSSARTVQKHVIRGERRNGDRKKYLVDDQWPIVRIVRV